MRRAVWLSVAIVGIPPVAGAFPPYRSTDADTAPLGVLEARVGIVRMQREGDENSYAAPLLRLNLGIARNMELVSEVEYDREEDQLGDGAIGLKLVAGEGPLRWGVETLALLPVNSMHSGVGIESQLVVTWSRAPVRVHFNAGGTYDSRPSDAERGWRASMLAEYEHALGRPGLELFARQFRGEPAEVQVGAGWIVPVRRFELRIGLHAGLTSHAPDLTASLWFSTQRRLWQSPKEIAGLRSAWR
jgi:hypothetical protein